MQNRHTQLTRDTAISSTAQRPAIRKGRTIRANYTLGRTNSPTVGASITCPRADVDAWAMSVRHAQQPGNHQLGCERPGMDRAAADTSCTVVIHLD